MKNIHLQKTDKPSRLYLNGFQVLSLDDKIEIVTDDYSENQHIYITNSEEIKNCWVLNTHTNQVYFLKGFYGIQPITKKIILTTDQDLIKDGVQAINDEFLEWFVNNPSCEWVEIIHGLFNLMERQVDLMNLGQNHSQCVWKYKIIIPKEEHKQEMPIVNGSYGCTIQTKRRETLEEAAEDFANSKKWMDGGVSEWVQHIFKEGAKWQAERSYSEEEVHKIIESYQNIMENNPIHTHYDKWFEQFKKK